MEYNFNFIIQSKINEYNDIWPIIFHYCDIFSSIQLSLTCNKFNKYFDNIVSKSKEQIVSQIINIDNDSDYVLITDTEGNNCIQLFFTVHDNDKINKIMHDFIIYFDEDMVKECITIKSTNNHMIAKRRLHTITEAIPIIHNLSSKFRKEQIKLIEQSLYYHSKYSGEHINEQNKESSETIRINKNKLTSYDKQNLYTMIEDGIYYVEYFRENGVSNKIKIVDGLSIDNDYLVVDIEKLNIYADSNYMSSVAIRGRWYYDFCWGFCDNNRIENIIININRIFNNIIKYQLNGE